MASHHQEAAMPLRQQLVRSLADIGFAHTLVEPEVGRAEVAKAQCKSLARIVTGLIAENEPLLVAECNGTTVTVRERGGHAAMCFTVEPVKSGGNQ